MSNQLETRLLIPLFEYLRTDPVIVDYKMFSRTCAEIMFFMSFLFTNLCVIRGFFFATWHHSETNTSFHDSLLRLLKEEMDDEDGEMLTGDHQETPPVIMSPDEDDDDDENESNQLDEKGNELASATDSILEINETEGLNNGDFDDEASKHLVATTTS